MNYSRIAGTGSYLPKRLVTNEDISKMVDTTDEWIMQRVGIKQRYIMEEDETLTSMAHAAAEAALDAAGIAAKDLDMIVVGNATPEHYFPSVACLVQKALDVPGIPAFDVAAACAGFIYGMSVADQYIKSGAAQRILVIGVEGLSRVVDWSDRSTCVLFGDGASAIVLEASSEPGVLSTHIHADGTYADMLSAETNMRDRNVDTHIHMDGSAVFRIAVRKLGDSVDEALADNDMLHEHIDWLIPHQANMRIISAMAKRLNLSMEQVILTIEQHGNTSSASVPLALDHAIREGKVQRGQVLLLEAFGAGFAWGSALVKY
ncbi:MAG: ketoacyl-ACP synthase III [Coxiellaceae bacterium]|nr:ketoacyl-ACP synthase III [Coxiellaceae bacterium]